MLGRFFLPPFKKNLFYLTKKGIFEESGSYVVIEMPHTTEVIQLVWKEAFSYLISKGYTLDKNRPVIERYRKALVDKHRCEMLFPVKS